MNLSPKQLMNPNLTDDFRRVLKKYKVPANEVCMEIVEFAMFDKMPEVHENIQKLVQCGFQIALDDFGLEMSSLKRLENLGKTRPLVYRRSERRPFDRRRGKLAGRLRGKERFPYHRRGDRGRRNAGFYQGTFDPVRAGLLFRQAQGARGIRYLSFFE